MNTPIALIIFNRPKQTKEVFETLRKIKPTKLYVIADGPRHENERDACEKARAIIDTIDWECDLKKKYSDKNLGCGINESKGLDWVFENEETAIILEDDCLPDDTFFRFCTELLEKYKDDKSVMHISGNFFQQKNKNFRDNHSYYASILPHVWGWATWRRAWQKYDYNLTSWPQTKKDGSLIPWFNNPAAYEYWSGIWDEYKTYEVNNYDARWVFACMINHAICINPTVNLITNIGFDESATHTKTPDDSANIPTTPMQFPLNHPASLNINYKADKYTFRKNFGVDEKLIYRIVRPIKTRFPKQYRALKRLFRKQV